MPKIEKQTLLVKDANGVWRFIPAVAGEGGGGIVLPATKERLGGVKVGENLTVTEDGVLSVDTTDDAEQDNTKPITSAGVNLVVGNINAILAII
jgi:hypothetical protein|nr:MAG TPA_asm: hypothetical protein [Caudoviricetes sp.]